MQSPPDVEVDSDEWRSITDRREKKRVQNRVAQRSYRKRVKQRLEDLQAQVNQVNEQRQPPPLPPPPQRQQPQHPRGDAASSSAPGELAPGKVACDGADGNAHVRPNYRLDPFFWSGHDLELPPELSGAHHPGGALSLERMGDVVGYPSAESIRRALSSKDSCSGDDAASSSPPAGSGGDPMLAKLAMPLRYPPDASSAYEHADRHGLPPMSQPMAPTWPPTAPPSSVSAVPELDAGASLEKRLEHLIATAKSLGFENFDTLATAYYASALDSSSIARLEQRLSRNRWLPSLLAEIRQLSAEWSAWERRGYEEEIIRSAEEICRKEWCAGLGSAAERWGTNHLTEVVLQDRLPNLWTFLSGLTASNDQAPPQHYQRAVHASILLLSGSGGPPNLMWSP